MTIGSEPIRQLAAALDAVCAADQAVLADGDTLVALHRQLERLEAATTRATAAFDAGRRWQADGARSAAAWIATRCRLPVPVARRRVGLGRALRSMPRVEAAWLAGDLGAAQVALLGDARTPATSGCFDRDQALLVRRRLGRGQGPPGRGGVRRGPGPLPAQCRADALVEMARRALAVPAGARLPEPLFSVLVGYETFAGPLCELADATVVAPGALVRWLDRAWVERVVFDAPDRIRNVGVRRRIFSGATRRAVEVRDRECYSEFRDVGAQDCQIDHVVPWAAGGLTTEHNGRPACAWHNRHRHRPSGPSP